jgi:hypothetical protein
MFDIADTIFASRGGVDHGISGVFVWLGHALAENRSDIPVRFVTVFCSMEY